MSTPAHDTAQLIQTVLQGLRINGATFTHVYLWEPGMGGASPPFAAVGLPTIDRIGLEQPESQLGGSGATTGPRDWTMSFPVALYFDLSSVDVAGDQAVAYVEAWIQAVDTDTLQASDGSIQDAKVTRSEPTEITDAGFPCLAYVTTLELLKLV